MEANDALAHSTYAVCGVRISALAPPAAALSIVRAAEDKRAMQVHLCNSYTLSLVDRDTKLRKALEESDLNLPDGAPLAAIGRGRGTVGPVRGPSLVGNVARLGVEAGTKHFLLGGKQGVAELMAQNLRNYAIGCEVAGVESPPFGSLSETYLDKVATNIRASGANLVWVGLGTPIQDHVVPRLASRLAMPIVPVGAAFDFWAGVIDEAPPWLHGSGFEWTHRLSREPRRLWRRYLIGSPLFAISALRHERSRRQGKA